MAHANVVFESKGKTTSSLYLRTDSIKTSVPSKVKAEAVPMTSLDEYNVSFSTADVTFQAKS